MQHSTEDTRWLRNAAGDKNLWVRTTIISGCSHLRTAFSHGGMNSLLGYGQHFSLGEKITCWDKYIFPLGEQILC